MNRPTLIKASAKNSRFKPFILLLSLSFANTMHAQHTKSVDDQVNFLNSLAGLPFEYRADLTLTAVESNSTLLRSTQVQARVKEIFEDAKLARHPYAQVLAAYTQDDTAEASFSGAQKSAQLDRLDITVRALRALMQFSPGRAYRDTLNVRIEPPSASCTEAYAYNVAPIYDFVAANTTVWLKDGMEDPTKLRQDIEVHWLDSLPTASVASVTALLAALPLNHADLEVLASELASHESRLAPTDRELGFLLTDGALLLNTDRLATKLDSAGLSSYQLLASLRILLIAGTRSRCGDSLIHAAETAKTYNNIIAKHQPTTIDLRLADDALKGTKNGTRAELHSIAPTGRESSTVQALMRYANRSDTNPIFNDVPDWDSASDSLLRAIVYETPHTNCDICDFYEKSMAYFLLENFSADVPLSSAKERALRAFSAFLIAERIANTDPVAWLSQFKLLINLSRQPAPDAKLRIEGLRSHGYHLQGLPSPSGVVVAHELQRSDDKVARAYIEFDKQFHTPYSSPY